MQKIPGLSSNIGVFDGKGWQYHMGSSKQEIFTSTVD